MGASLASGMRWSPRWFVSTVVWLAWPPMRSVHLEPYDPRWPQQFDIERARLAAALGPLAVAIEHIGSTAVPGCPAKPTIDVQVEVDRVDPQEDYDRALARLGYVHFAMGLGHTAVQRFYRPMISRRFHVWVRQRDSREAIEARAFRDALVADALLTDAYSSLKERLATVHHRDRSAYTDGKTAFIRDALDGGVA